jgi:hypothetical protein
MQRSPSALYATRRFITMLNKRLPLGPFQNRMNPIRISRSCPISSPLIVPKICSKSEALCNRIQNALRSAPGLTFEPSLGSWPDCDVCKLCVLLSEEGAQACRQAQRLLHVTVKIVTLILSLHDHSFLCRLQGIHDPLTVWIWGWSCIQRCFYRAVIGSLPNPKAGRSSLYQLPSDCQLPSTSGGRRLRL